MFVDVKLVYGRSMLPRMPKRKALASIGSTPRAVLLHKIPAVAHSVAHFAAKPAPNTPNLCNTLCCKLLICIRRAYYLSDFKTAAFSQLGHSSALNCTLNPSSGCDHTPSASSLIEQ